MHDARFRTQHIVVFKRFHEECVIKEMVILLLSLAFLIELAVFVHLARMLWQEHFPKHRPSEDQKGDRQAK